MKRLILTLFALATTVLLSGATSKSYDVEAVYQQLDSRDLVAITRSGNMVDIDVLLKKHNLNIGKYKVSLRRVGDGLYQVDNGSLHIKTRYCYEYGLNDAILTITSQYGYSIGTVEFR